MNPRSPPPGDFRQQREQQQSEQQHHQQQSDSMQSYYDVPAQRASPSPHHYPSSRPAPSREASYSHRQAQEEQQQQPSHYAPSERGYPSHDPSYNPSEPSYALGGYGGESQHNLVHPEPYYGEPGDQSAHTINWDERSTHSQTALNNLEKDYYKQGGQPAHQYQQPPMMSLAYGAPEYPPSSPYGNQRGQYDDESYQNEYNLAREQLYKRRSVRQVELTDGHLVLECPVPRSILQFNQFKGNDLSEESGKMRYTAVTEDPDDFTRERYRLRQTLMSRETELFICLTMYNEDENLFCRTFTSIIKNIQHLQSRSKSKMWGDGSWKKVVVCVVSDGRAKINQRTLKVLGLYGAYQDGIAKDTVDGKDVKAHVFEYTTQVLVDAHGTVSGGIAPVQILFCLKEQNQKKLNSHRWAFNAFCPQLRPNVCVLLDAGTRPSGTSIYSLWKTFDKHSGVGGACGEITVDLGRGCSNLLNPLVAAQNFEYKMSNILDKPLESIFGYISVLPGAFSAYRYKALLNGPDGRGPLQVYFAGEKMHSNDPGVMASLAESNMYLAEDRILCFELVAKRNEAWTLKYVKSAKASTDVPDTVAELISQRRRWYNGSFFASTHATTHYYRIWTSGQGFFRKCWLSLLFLYNLVQLIFQFIGLSSFYLAFFFLCQSAISESGSDPFGGKGQDVISVCNSLYIATLGVTIVCALGNKPAGSKWWYTLVMIVFAALFCIALYCTGWTIWLSVPHTLAGWQNFRELLKQSGFRDIVISVGATYGLYIVASILHAEPWHLITSLVQYMLLLPSFVSVLTIYSFSNLHDISWGTKGSTTVKDLGGATKKKTEDGKVLVTVDLVSAPDDVDALWNGMRKEIGTPYVERHVKRDAGAKKEDHYANIRTNTLLTYLGVNMVIVIFFTSSFWTTFLAARSVGDPTGPVVNYYMVGIFWSVAALSAIRFLGSTWYLILRIVGW